jgi:ABC-type multidrug transport system fused ATPase/permease subunit
MLIIQSFQLSDILLMPLHHLLLGRLISFWQNRSSNFNITLGFLVDHVSEAEAAITSVERIRGMSELPQEKSMKTDKENRPTKDWPARGKLEFQDVALRYRPGLPLALNGLSFAVEPGQRCGVVGRTGAGKSSLTVALFRLVEVASGRILLDDVDLSKLGLSDVRGRSNGLSIIPQDPVLMKGTLRSVLDPFGSCTDDEIFEALTCVRLAYGRGVEMLDAPVDEGGTNFSVGERQLLCMARAMLSKPRVLCLDEATASVDRQSDAFIQKMLRSRFQGTTLLTIAHRLDTIMDYDVVLVMDSGKAAEFGPPHDLLENEAGVFSELVRNTGKESANALKTIASNASLSQLS